ncbi:SRPBCC family protein [Streptomyces sp. AN091965]|uniref:SRPBCC family protein n=1 Tax=Streptomyces sp. AN091965 TaxID=2927803 RepID=UPI001F6182A4|nr:SRPBCC family protein [Streptomyces sp. AN091965]MCI3927820.1 SRPBCC family protein [Streptomyces sp. AN091965]
MAVRHRLIRKPPTEVWAVLADGNQYAEWVVGTAESRPVRGRWPREDAAIAYEIRLGPLRLANETVVRRCREGSTLELEAHAGPLGTARIAVDLRAWGEHCLVSLDEHPLRGAGGWLHNAGFEALIQLRHRAMLGRLARLCEDGGRSARVDGGSPQAAAVAGGGSGPDHA